MVEEDRLLATVEADEAAGVQDRDLVPVVGCWREVGILNREHVLRDLGHEDCVEGVLVRYNASGCSRQGSSSGGELCVARPGNAKARLPPAIDEAWPAVTESDDEPGIHVDLMTEAPPTARRSRLPFGEPRE